MIPTLFHVTDAPRRPDGWLDRRWNRIPASCFAYRRECHEVIGYWDETLERWGDWDFWGRILARWGRESFAYVPELSVFHFKANWKKADHEDECTQWLWEALDAEPGRLGSALRLPVPPGAVEQEVFLAALRGRPDWLAEVRRDHVRALDSFAAEARLRLDRATQRIREIETRFTLPWIRDHLRNPAGLWRSVRRAMR